MINRDTIQKIQDTLKIEEVISDFVTLRRNGSGFVACCPFHNEKTPSFHVSPAKGIYKCFGCGKSGSAVSFVMDYEHCSYADALKYIAKKYRIDVVEEELSAEEIVARQKRESLLIVTEFAHKFFKDQLGTQEGRAVAMAYYHSRGLEDDTIAREGLGWAPSGKSTLVDAAVAAGHKMEYLIETGLAVKHDDGSVSDRFRERVMFPIYSVSGRVIAFSGRTLKSDSPAKYVNSPESEIYVKSRALLGIYQAKTEISKQDKCFLVEGNIDVITLHQLGIQNVVASCGTSLTPEQIRLIRKFTTNLTIMYDGDKAGIKAALRGTDMVLEEGMNVRIVLLPDGEDPDSFGRKNTLAQFQDYIREHEQDFISFKSDRLLLSAGTDPIKRAGVINDIADSIAKIPDAVVRSVYVQECAKKFAIEEQILFDRIGRVNTQKILNAKPAAEQKEEVEVSVSQGSFVYHPENKILAPVEAEILGYLLRYAEAPLKFETDSQYYSPDPLSVADFIVNVLEEDGYRMANSVYECIYEGFKTMYYDQGLSVDAIARRFMDGEDRLAASVVGELTIDRYEITVKNFKASHTTLGSWLTVNVPKTLIILAIRRLESQVKDLQEQIKKTADPQEQFSLLQECTALQKKQRMIKDKNKNEYGKEL